MEDGGWRMQILALLLPYIVGLGWAGLLLGALLYDEMG